LIIVGILLILAGPVFGWLEGNIVLYAGIICLVIGIIIKIFAKGGKGDVGSGTPMETKSEDSSQTPPKEPEF